MRIFFCCLFHETNGFAPGVSALKDFTYRSGADVLSSALKGSLTKAIEEEASTHGITLVPSFYLGASPGPIVSDEVVALALRHIDEDLPRALTEGIDGIYLILHGAMVSQSHDDVEGLVLSRIAHHLGNRNTPVAAILDLHANVSPAMAESTNMLLAYRCNPHTDAVESGLRAFHLLTGSIQSGVTCHTHLVQMPVLLPPVGTATHSQPMAGLLEIARRQESDAIPAISVCPGFSHADTSFTGLSFQIVVQDGEEERIEQISKELTTSAMANARAGLPMEWELDDAIADAQKHKAFPTLIVEPADNIGGGAPGDATWVLKAFLDHNLDHCGVILSAPEAVQYLQNHPVDETVAITLGGKNPQLSGPALTIPVTIIKHSEGAFDVEDKHSHFVSSRGTRIQMGRSVLVRCEGVILLLTTLPTAPNDLGQWRCVDVHPETLHFIGIKAAIAHRQAYDPISKRSYTVSTPGPCTSNLHLLPYRKLRRPIFPLDDISSFLEDAMSPPTEQSNNTN